MQNEKYQQKKTEEKVEMTDEQVNSLLEIKKQKRLFECKKEIDGVLKKYNCGLSASVVITSQGNNVQIQIIVK